MIKIRENTKNKFKNKIREFTNSLSRSVHVYKEPTKTECPNCYFDSLTQKSTNTCKWTALEAIQKQSDWESNGGTGVRYKFFNRSRCPVCYGRGYLETQNTVYINCKVVWEPKASNSSNAITSLPAGFEGATEVELKTDPKYIDIFKIAVKVVIDGIDCKLSKPPIIRGIGNQSILVLKLFTTDKFGNSSEVFKDY